MRCLPKIFWFCRRDVHKCLRMPVHQRKPGALHLHHHTMAAAESVENVRHREFDLRHFARFKWLRFLETLAKLAAEHVSPHELLVTAHPNVSRIRVGITEVP